MPNVFASAGACARAQNELSMLFVQARKMISSENNLPSTTAKERDTEFGRSLTNTLGKADADTRSLKATLQLAKVGIAIVKLVGAGISAAKSGSQASSAKEAGAANTAELKNTASKDMAKALGSAVAVGQQVIATVNALADMKKADKNRKTLDGESGSLDAATKSMDTTGRA
ncbi:MAG: hypothetical protein H7338_23865 [Candidatus Sericytochromatia bacterium]|nr:hypothetical protein [Candidatus Sericytochromatia bacterium]